MDGHDDVNIVSIDNEGGTEQTQGTVTSSIQTFPFLNDTDSESESVDPHWNLLSRLSLLRFGRNKRKFTKLSIGMSGT